jgi:Tol biopolymer transport system component
MTTTSRDRLLTGIGLLAFLLYVLACRPSFSPDGTKILVPIHDPAHTNTAVWVYDRGQQTWTKVYESAGTYILPYVNWTGDGQQAVITPPAGAHAEPL